MILSTIFIILSMIIDGVLSNYINYQISNPSLITPLFVVVSIPLIYQFFEKNNSKYLKYLIVFGFIYDFCFTGSLILNSIIFFVIGYITIIFNKLLSSNSLNNLFLVILCIVLYNFFNYCILAIFNQNNCNIWYLFNIIKSTLILNILYGFFWVLFIRFYKQ